MILSSHCQFCSHSGRIQRVCKQTSHQWYQEIRCNSLQKGEISEFSGCSLIGLEGINNASVNESGEREDGDKNNKWFQIIENWQFTKLSDVGWFCNHIW